MFMHTAGLTRFLPQNLATRTDESQPVGFANDEPRLMSANGVQIRNENTLCLFSLEPL